VRRLDPLALGTAAALAMAPSLARAQARPTAIPLSPTPTAITPGVAAQLGSDGVAPTAAEGEATTSYFPLYERTTETTRLRLAPPFYLAHTRLLPPLPRAFDAEGPQDEESLSGLLYYRRRSPRIDSDVLFPLVWSERRDDAHTLTIGPVHLERSPRHWDNWLAPLWFAGESTKGGYFHAPLLLTTTSFDDAGAFALAGPYFRTREGLAEKRGVVPFWFEGDNHDEEGNRRAYTLVPPGLYYHHEHEVDDDTLTVAGPLLWRTTGETSRFYAMPFWFSVDVNAEDPAKSERYRTLFPLFHTGEGPGTKTLALPGYVSHVTPTSDLVYTPLYTRSDTQTGARTLELAGPVVPLWFRYRDRDLASDTWGLMPLFATHASASSRGWYTPLAAHHVREGYGSTTFVAPTFELQLNHDGWAANLHPLVYIGSKGEASHAVVAPLYWDFDDAESRSTVAFPLFWRFENHVEGRVSALAANVYWQERRVAGGVAKQSHVFPITSWGTSPDGSFWSVLYGLAGHEREGANHTARALWIPFRWRDEAADATLGLAPVGPFAL
jgi:hypothetical protein